jgi:uncharacterized membrane protein
MSSIIKSIILYILFSMSFLIMLLTIVQYASFDPSIAFLAQKQQCINNNIWRSAFYIHVFSAIFTLFAGFTQFSSIISSNKYWHRLIGKVYVILILFVNFPSGLILAYHANGLLPSKIAFLILDCFWFLFTLRAVIFIKNGEIEKHKKFMMRSFALTFSAITFRLWKIILINFISLDEATIYMIDAWLGFVPNLIVVESIIYYRKKSIFGT